jgi:hypothetical protein
MKPDTIKNDNSVPMIPKNDIIPKFSKNNDFLKLYPAAKMMGGNINIKNI